jgi:hypothetical protein
MKACGLDVMTLTLGSRPKQRHGKVWAKSTTQESHFHSRECEGMNPHTLPSGLPLWELESFWSREYSKKYIRGQNSLDQRVPSTIGKILKLKFLKWVHLTHLST